MQSNVGTKPPKRELTFQILPLALESLNAVSQSRAIAACDVILEAMKNQRMLLDIYCEDFERDRILSRVESIRHLVQTCDSHLLPKVIAMVEKQRDKFKKEGSSYDYMIQGCLERYQFHPYTALEMLRKAITISPHNYEVYIYVSNLLNSDEFDRPLDSIKCLHVAIALCDYLLAVEYDEFSYRRISANRLVLLGRIEGHTKKPGGDLDVQNRELQYYKDALAIDPTAFHAMFYCGFYYGFSTSSSLVTANVTPERGLAFEKSISYFSQTLPILDDNKKVIFQSIIYNNIAAMKIQLQLDDEALEWYDLTLKENKNMGWAIRDKSFCLRNKNQHKEAIENYNYCINVLQPENPKTKAELIATKAFWEVSLSGARNEAVLGDLNEVVKMDPSSSFGWYLKAIVLWNMERRQDSTDCINLGIRSCRDSNPMGLAQLLERRADIQSSIAASDATLCKEISRNFSCTFMRIL